MTGKKPDSRMAIVPRVFKTIAMFGLAAHIGGCAPDARLADANKKLEQANAKIAELEAQLAKQPMAKRPSVAQDSSPSAPPELPETVLGQQWFYDVSEDAMTSGKRYVARVESTNTVSFGFPYQGAQHGSLTLRTDPRHGKDVIFQIEQGQILCPSYEGCTVQVRFDDEKPRTYAASGAADHSTEVIFLGDYKGFFAKLKKAKRVRIAVSIYQQGAPVFEFDVSGFDTAKYLPKS